MKYPLSDHCDGKRFANPTHPEEPGLWETTKMLVGMRRRRWPDHVENTPALDVDGPIAPDRVGITFVNHATVLIQLPGLNILTDPVWSNRASPVSWSGPKRVRDPGIALAALPKIDVVGISHNHYDHTDLAALKTLSRRFAPRMLVPLGDRVLLESEGIQSVQEMDWWDTGEVGPQAAITFAPTQHFSSRGLLDRNGSLWGSYVMRSYGHLIYFGGDSGYSAHFKEIRARFGPADIALLPIGAYEPRWFMKAVHLNPAEAVQAHVDLGARQSIGIHFGTFQLTEEEIDAPVRELAAALGKWQLAPGAFVTLPEGVTTKYRMASVAAGATSAPNHG